MRDRTEAASKAKELVSRMTLEEKASQLKYDAPVFVCDCDGRFVANL